MVLSYTFSIKKTITDTVNMMMKRNVLFYNNHDIHQLFIFITTAERLKVH